jgi:ABC-type branched-subunit amino acid transport system ATPase component
MALFEAKDLHLRFGDRVVLENVSLAFEAGQLSGIMGPNGAGKTTCFNVLTGRYKPHRGQVLWEGQDITGRSAQAIARLADHILKLKGSVTIVIIEHDMEFLFSLADQISVIHWGQVIARGTPAALKANPWVEASNLGRLN